MKLPRLVALGTLAAMHGYGALRSSDPGEDALSRAVMREYRADCRRARDLLTGPSVPDLPVDTFGWAVAMLPCAGDPPSDQVLARAWEFAGDDSVALGRLVGSSAGAGGQVLFRRMLAVARASDRTTEVRLAAVRGLAMYVDPNLVLRFPRNAPPRYSGIAHSPFNGLAEYEAHAPDTVVALLGAMAADSAHQRISSSAVWALELLTMRMRQPAFQLTETARRNRIGPRAAGCYSIVYDRPIVVGSHEPRQRDREVLALWLQRDPHSYGDARMLRTPPADRAGSWRTAGPDSVVVYRTAGRYYTRITFRLGEAHAGVIVPGEPAGLGATIEPVGCPGQLRGPSPPDEAAS